VFGPGARERAVELITVVHLSNLEHKDSLCRTHHTAAGLTEASQLQTTHNCWHDTDDTAQLLQWTQHNFQLKLRTLMAYETCWTTLANTTPPNMLLPQPHTIHTTRHPFAPPPAAHNPKGTNRGHDHLALKVGLASGLQDGGTAQIGRHDNDGVLEAHCAALSTDRSWPEIPHLSGVCVVQGGGGGVKDCV
jgi:hypothetical protein